MKLRLTRRLESSKSSPLPLQALREQLGVRRADVARRLGRTPQAVMQFENGLDPKVGTLADYVKALADEIDSVEGSLRLTAVFDDAEYDVAVGATEAEGAEDTPQTELRTAGARSGPAIAQRSAWKVGSLRWFTADEVAQMLDGGFIALSNDEIDTTDLPDDREITERFRQYFQEHSGTPDHKGIPTFVRYWRTFLTSMRDDDVVVLPVAPGLVAIGVVTGPFRRVDAASPKLRNRRQVRWLATDVSREDLPNDLRSSLRARHSISQIRAVDAATRLRSITAGEGTHQ